jgi:bifunctional non-homologous end joining protein LigD
LAAYRDKRDAAATPEPFGSDGVERPGLFVVQLHAARNLHYDLRIEVGGVLKSWAVPRGPSLDPAEKRFAVATEDHPLEYADFEGVIPAGNYGAGEMIVWDRGLCVPHIEHAEGLEHGKLLFELKGFKLRGLWTLVKTKRDREWLLIKKPDAAATGDDAADLGAGSVLSGLTVEELRDGSGRAAEIRRRLQELGAPRRPLDPAKLELTLCEHRRRPFSKQGWIYEIKYDGYRLAAVKSPPEAGESPVRPDRRGARFYFRSGLEATVSFPDLARAVAALPYARLVLDGEVTILDEDGRPDFHRLQQRGRLSRPADAERAALRMPATYFVFDLLGFEDFDLRPLPLAERKRLLRRLLPAAGPLRFADHVEDRGEDFYRAVTEMGLEGIVAKRADSAYPGGRSSHWIKVRTDRVGDFAVVGWMLPEGGRTGFRALHLAALDGGELTYVGRVGSGFSETQLEEIRRHLDAIRRDRPAFSGEVPAGKHVWVEPRLVAEVRFAEYSPSGMLRFPVFLRLRDDKPVGECVREPPSAGETPAPEAREEAPAGPAATLFTNLDKVFWSAEGYTKGDLIAYYREISPWLLPYLRDRPVVLDRYPDGIAGKSFFQKNAPDFTPDWVRTESIWSEDGGSTLYFVADDLDTLLYLVNLGTIPLHVGASRVSTLQTPDWCVLDLDAKEASFADAVVVAQAVHRLCSGIELDAYVKTSGATGLHVLIPLGAGCTYQQARLLGELLARVIAAELPEVASTARTAKMRKGRIYVDFLQNGHGKLLVAPLSVRPLAGAPVSMPLRWDELDGHLDPRDFDISTASRRLETLESDPIRGVLAGGIRLGESLRHLAKRLKGPKDEDFFTTKPETP